MAIEQRGMAVEIVLDALRRDQDRLIRYMTAGFVAGFLIGIIAAWLMIHL